MNEKFFELPVEKQNRIISAGYRVFAYNSYKKAPVREIAEEAGISKSLLFHYFKNKKELYLYLLTMGGERTINALEKAGCFTEDNRFSAIKKGMKAKLDLMVKEPELSTFMIRAYFEKDPDVKHEISQYMQSKEYVRASRNGMEAQTQNPDKEMMYKSMRFAVEGFLFEKMMDNELEPQKMEEEFQNLLEHWEKIYNE